METLPVKAILELLPTEVLAISANARESEVVTIVLSLVAFIVSWVSVTLLIWVTAAPKVISTSLTRPIPAAASANLLAVAVAKAIGKA